MTAHSFLIPRGAAVARPPTGLIGPSPKVMEVTVDVKKEVDKRSIAFAAADTVDLVMVPERGLVLGFHYEIVQADSDPGAGNPTISVGDSDAATTWLNAQGAEAVANGVVLATDSDTMLQKYYGDGDTIFMTVNTAALTDLIVKFQFVLVPFMPYQVS